MWGVQWLQCASIAIIIIKIELYQRLNAAFLFLPVLSHSPYSPFPFHGEEEDEEDIRSEYDDTVLMPYV